MGARIKPMPLASGDREILERWIRARSTAQRLVIRSRIVLLLAEGRPGRAVAKAVGVSRHTVDLWRQRFLSGGCPALARDKPGRGRKTQR